MQVRLRYRSSGIMRRRIFVRPRLFHEIVARGNRRFRRCEQVLGRWFSSWSASVTEVLTLRARSSCVIVLLSSDSVLLNEKRKCPFG